jgi:hypothetical protein
MDGLPQVRVVWQSLRPQTANRKRTNVGKSRRTDC